MEIEEFRDFIGKKFSVRVQETQVDLELIHLQEFAPRLVPGLRERPFALLFRGPASPTQIETLPRQVHDLYSTDGKTFSIYLERVVGTGYPGTVYEAVFN